MYRLDKQYDIKKIKSEYAELVEKVGWTPGLPDHFDAITLQTDGTEDYHLHYDIDKFYIRHWDDNDVKEWTEQNESFKQLLIPPEWEMSKFIIENNLTRTRILRIAPRFVYNTHKDWTDRCQLGIITNEYCYYIEESVLYNIPDDGYGYVTETTKMHSAANASTEHRVNLVGCINVA